MSNLLFCNDREGEYPNSWYAATVDELPPQPPLVGHKSCDVCVVGGGYSGLSTALHLRQRGFDAVLLEAHRVGWGASGRNGGQLGSGQRQDQDELETLVGDAPARRLWDLAEEAKATALQLIENHQIDCDFKPGIIHADHKPRYVAHSHRYADKLNREYGYSQIAPLDRGAIRNLVASDDYHGGLIDRGSGHLHPLRYALGLAKAALAAGVVVHEKSLVVIWNRQASGIEIITNEGSVKAQHLVLACNGYLGDMDEMVARHTMPINNFIIATEPLGDAGAQSLIAEDVAVADSRFVVNYFRRSHDHRLLFGGGENYGYQFPKDIAEFVRKPMLKVFPQLADTRIDFAWGGTLAITMNRMPYFARPHPNVWSISGYSGHGVAMATMAGKLVCEAISGQEERFDLMARVPSPKFPGGRLLRSPLLALGMLWYALRDRL
ncbi:MAG: FAD-binding oxidoreductase [Pseudomonadota bacterium]